MGVASKPHPLGVDRLFFYLDGHIGAAKFAEAAGITFLRRDNNNLFLIIEFKDLFRAKSDTNPAALTPLPVYDYFLLFFQCFNHHASV